MFGRVLRVLFACGVVVAAAMPACGGSSSNPSDTTAGGGGSANHGGNADSSALPGAAGAVEAGPVQCGSTRCQDVPIPQVQNFAIPACCADAATSSCGLDSTFLSMFGPTFTDACQPLAQPGVKDPACPDSAATPVSGTPLTIKFPGCCRANGTCGYQLDSIGGLIPIGLGCVDSAPFLDGGTLRSCGEGGMGGAGATDVGAGGISGEAGGGATGR